MKKSELVFRQKSGLKDTPLTGRTELKTESILKAMYIPKKSEKQVQTDSKLVSVYNSMKVERESCCTGCGTDSFLQHSHIIPRSRSEKLIAVKENITYHCMKCHEIWEHGSLEEMKTLNDFSKSMEYIKKTDFVYYKILQFKK